MVYATGEPCKTTEIEGRPSCCINLGSYGGDRFFQLPYSSLPATKENRFYIENPEAGASNAD